MSKWAPSVATRPANGLRLVTITRLPRPPGSSGRTWSISRALSRSTSTRLRESRLRYIPICPSKPSGICGAGTPSECSRECSAPVVDVIPPLASNPWRFRYS